MVFNSRFLGFSIALALSLGITIITGYFTSTTELFLTAIFFSVFAFTYLITFFSLEYFFFREIKNIRRLIEKLKKKEIPIDPKTQNIHTPLYAVNKEIYHYASIKQKEIEELKRMEQFRREFVANVSHELKTPIFSAQGYVHTLLDGAVKDKNVRNKFLNKAAKNLDNLSMLVQDLLILSQIETGEIKMNFEFFDIGRLLSDIIDQFEDKAAKKDISLLLRQPKGSKDLNVYGDWRRIQQVLNNLVSNAINYSNEGGNIIIHVIPDQKSVTISVQDSGIGIPEEDISRIFERFYRVDKSRSRSRGGTGLGLAIVKHIMEGHKTTINVKSKPGNGSTFSFQLPTEEHNQGSL